MTAPTLEDLGRRGRTLLVLACLGRSSGPLTMAEFTRASQLVPEVARALREDLEKWGLVESEVIGQRGVVGRRAIRLTPLGRALARHTLAMDDILVKARAADPPPPPPPAAPPWQERPPPPSHGLQ